MEGDPLPEPEAPVALHGGAGRLWFSHTVRADDSDADGLGTPSSEVGVARDGSALDDSLAGIVPSRHPGRPGRRGRPAA